jgi:lipooligosaccharide transport system ATP-binding protein
MEAVVIGKDLRKNYGDFVAVDGIDFEIPKGACFGFLGPNGAGKTTTMRMIYRASPIGSGSLRILGHEVDNGRNDRQIKQQMGVVPQEDNLDQELSVRENLEVFARFYGLGRREAKTRAVELLEFVRLTDKADAKVLELSGGMKRRVLIARGLVGNPRLVVLDEPTTGLDPQARLNLWDRMRDLKRKEATLILTTHYMDEAEQLCDTLVIMDKGKIVAQGRPRDLIKQHVSSHVVEIGLETTAHRGSRSERCEAGDGAASSDTQMPPAAGEIAALAKRFEQHHDRLLLYVDDGEAVVTRAAQLLPDAETLLRRSTLEDVFLRITGRGLEE